MPYIFSQSQIERCHHLMTEHNMEATSIANIMGCGYRDAHHLIRLVNQKYPKPKRYAFRPSKLHPNGRPIDKFLEKEKVVFVRPKAEYSNQRLYDLI